MERSNQSNQNIDNFFEELKYLDDYGELFDNDFVWPNEVLNHIQNDNDNIINNLNRNSNRYSANNGRHFPPSMSTELDNIF
jgi:hypothetical protein